MGLFSKNRKKNKEDIVEKVPTSERIVFEKLASDDDKYLIKLADEMLQGNPLILSFDALDIDQANKVIAFLSGVVYAIKGEILNINEKVFMFADQHVYADGTIEDFLKEIVE